MLNNFLEIILLIKYPLIGLFLIYALLSFYWVPIFKSFNLKTYNNIQRVHTNEVSRVGGLVMYLFFWAIYFLDLINDQLFFNILFSAIPFVLISIKEDLFHNTAPKNRLILMMISCLIFFNIQLILFPVINFPILGEAISLYPVNLIFFTFSVLIIMNGMNLIDGMNGLFGSTALSQLACLGILAYVNNDYEIMFISFTFLLPLLVFLLFNFPFGKIFIGDLGAYLYGFVIGNLTIIFFGRQPQLTSWLAVLILFYPCFELLFSYLRKIIENKSPLMADNQHLHSLAYKNFSKKNKVGTFVNVRVTILLTIFGIIPPLLAFFLQDVFSIIIVLFILVFTYFLLYKKLKNKLYG